jgi:TrkA domain protein
LSGRAMADVNETRLPGIGVRYEFVTYEGVRVGVLHHRTGRRDLLVFDQEDPDACRAVIRLDEGDSRTLSEVLGGSRIARELAELQQQVEGLAIDWLPVPAGTPFAGRTIGDTRARTATGVSIVAVIRGQAAHAAPGPEFTLAPGDTLLVVGTARGIEELAVILRTG